MASSSGSTEPTKSDNSEVIKLFNSLTITRKEINNLRKDLRRLNLCYQKDIDNILTTLKTWKCESCSINAGEGKSENPAEFSDRDLIPFQPIGVISTSFHEKRGTPRQSGICASTQGKLTLFNTVFTNPNHALEGLEEFSHMWILFHFHKNDSTHVRAKIAPPRLNGLKTGVFGTRSPHRPSPIGLSLVHIDFIEASSVYFSGVDMLDGTPVLDIKPYIPQYDNPTFLANQWNTESQRSKPIYGSHSELLDHSSIPREAPDGEENCAEDISRITISSSPINDQVRVPQWITEPTVSQLSVTFKEKARSELNTITQSLTVASADDIDTKEDLESCITRILEEDPRSVYVRERYSNQFYTFLIGKYHVSCKFDDCNHSVQVYKITKADSLTSFQ